MVKTFARKLLPLIFIAAGVVAAQTAPPPPPGFVPVTPIRTTQQHAPSQKDIPAIAKSANGSIVSIVMSDKDSKPLGQGSGFLVSNDGLLVTNYHVIAEGVSAVAKLPDGAFYLIDGVVASDKSRDVAILKAHGHNFRPLSLGNSDRVQVGEEVVAIGSPLSLESTVSNGIVSGMRTAEDLGGKFLQVTAPISPGSSGGPLFNMAGEVIGITTLYLKGGENLNFAIPINDAKRLLLSKSSKLHDLPNETIRAAQPEATSAFLDETELYDTMKWMTNSFREENRGTYVVRDGLAHITLFLWSILAQGPGGGASVIVERLVSTPHHSSDQTVESNDRFNLRDFDPNTISLQKIPGGNYLFTARTTNDELKIEDRAHEQKTNSVTFELDPDYGPRFTKAFKHAVELCGGKPSKF